MEINCVYCKRICKNANSKKQHEIWCKENPNKKIHKNTNKKINNGFKKGVVPWNKGKTYEELLGHEKAEILKTKLLKNHRCGGKAKTKEAEIKRTEKIRISINKRYANGWQPVCGKCPKYEYDSPIAGKIKVDGSWELKVCKYLDSINVKWKRNKKRFPYINLQNKKSTYAPDFFVDDWNSYIEVKGYETKLDACKWSQFTEKLIIWRKKDLQTLKIL